MVTLSTDLAIKEDIGKTNPNWTKVISFMNEMEFPSIASSLKKKFNVK